MKNFIVARIFSKEEYADEFIKGIVRMNPLYSYGPNEKNITSKSDKRLDFYEGSLAYYTSGKECEIFNGFPEVLRNDIKEVWLPDDYIMRFRIYCMTCVNYENNTPIKPDESLRKFGNCVVIFKDFEEFYKRLKDKICSEFLVNRKPKIYLDRVHYYKRDKSKRLLALFQKDISYSIKNELRIAVGKMSCDYEAKTERAFTDIDRSLEPYIYDIGDISDLVIKLSIDDFINLRFPENFTPKFANTPLVSNKTLETEKELFSYEPKEIRPIFTV